MTSNQYRAALKQLGDLSQTQMARFLHIDPRTSRRYALGELSVPPLIAKLLRYMIKHKLTVEDFA
jgi:hypothetical protein